VVAFEYAPAPESRSVVSIESSYGLFIDGEFVESTGGSMIKTINPATEEVLAEVSEANQADIDRAVSAARKAFTKTWGPMPGRDRAKYLFRIARLIQERSRELAVLETLDNGKPIREARDVDIPLVAAHFFYHAGWADKLEHAGYGLSPRPLGVADRSGTGVRQHRGAEARRDHLAHGAGVRRHLPAGRPATRGRQHHHRGG
jgi:aldehyde dehydrogenase (NAD+)